MGYPFLIALDGTWSTRVNGFERRFDSSGRRVGRAPMRVRTNVRRFFVECRLPPTQKAYFNGPEDPLGGDAWRIYDDAINVIVEQMNRGCDAFILVGWSRGAAIASELTEAIRRLDEDNTLLERGSRRVPGKPGRVGPKRRRVLRPVRAFDRRRRARVRFLGMFDAVAMIASAQNSIEHRWGDRVERVDYFAHVVAKDRTGPLGLLDFRSARPQVEARRREVLTLDGTHGDVGLDGPDPVNQNAYRFIRRHASAAGVP